MDKQEQKKKIHASLQKKIGRPATTEKEKRMNAAAVDVLAGDKRADVERLFGVHTEELNRHIKKLFPTDEEKWEFLEDCMVTNTAIAMKQFQEHAHGMTAIESAKAASTFANSALAIKKARESGFREPVVSVTAILNLERTLKNLTTIPDAA